MLVELWNYLNSLEFKTPDPIAKERYFFAPPFKILLLNIAYLSFVLKIGPAIMKNREPFKMKKILLFYNFFQVLLNLFVPIIAYVMIVHFKIYEIGCMIMLPPGHQYKSLEVYCFYVYYLIKFIDYMDTIFFVLRKSYRQVTFLHVYHHILMANCAYGYMRYYGFGGHIGTLGILNSIVHVFMYYYYLSSALKPSLRADAVWWKKYITRLQLIQFVIIILHNLYPLLYRPDCGNPFLFLFAILQASIMLYLFGKFYYNTYIRKGNKTSDKAVIVDKAAKSKSE